MSVGTADHLLDDSLLFAGRYAAAENEVELFVAPDMPHGFQAFPCGITSAWVGHVRPVAGRPPGLSRAAPSAGTGRITRAGVTTADRSRT